MKAMSTKPPLTGTPWFIALAYFCVACMLLVPVLAVDHPQAVDLANHLARQYVRHALPASDVLSRMYFFKWMFFPYLAFDLAMEPLLSFFSVYDAGRIVLGATLVLWMLAPAALYFALWGRWSAWPLLASLIAYNANIVWGFSAYSLVSGLAVLVFSAWITTAKMATGKRLAVFSTLSFLLYCGHLTGFAVFALLLGSYELGLLLKEKRVSFTGIFRRAWLLAPLFLPAVLHFAFISWKYPPLHEVITLPLGWEDRMLMLCSPFLDGLRTSFAGQTRNLFSASSLFFLAGVLVVLALRKSLAFHRDMLLPLIALAVLSLIMPPKLLGITFMHYRLPCVTLALLVSSVRITEKDGRLLKVIALLFVLTLAARMQDVTRIWQGYDRQAREFIARTQVIKPGDKVLVVNRQFPAFVEHYHTASFLPIERQAFIPGLFAIMYYFGPTGEFKRLTHPTATHPIDARLLRLALAGSDPRLAKPQHAYWRTWWKDFDYVIAYEENVKDDFYKGLMTPVAKGSFFVIYRMKPPAEQKMPANVRPAKRLK